MNSYEVIVVFARTTGERRIWRTAVYSQANGASEHEVKRRLLEWYLKKRYQVKNIKVKK
jgi:hypothetical protein